MSKFGATKEKRNRTDLGLAILSAITLPGQCRSHREIAAYCDCHSNNIIRIEQTGLQKLRKRFAKLKDPVLREMFEGLFQ